MSFHTTKKTRPFPLLADTVTDLAETRLQRLSALAVPMLIAL